MILSPFLSVSIGALWWQALGLDPAQVMWIARNSFVPRTERDCDPEDERPPSREDQFGFDNCQVPHPVGGLLPNDWGLYDTAGNAWELVFDPYTPRLPDDAHLDPVVGFGEGGRGQGAPSIRGGTAVLDIPYADPGYHHAAWDGGEAYVGLRVVRTVLQPERAETSPP